MIEYDGNGNPKLTAGMGVDLKALNHHLRSRNWEAALASCDDIKKRIDDVEGGINEEQFGEHKRAAAKAAHPEHE